MSHTFELCYCILIISLVSYLWGYLSKMRQIITTFIGLKCDVSQSMSLTPSSKMGTRYLCRTTLTIFWDSVMHTLLLWQTSINFYLVVSHLNITLYLTIFLQLLEMEMMPCLMISAIFVSILVAFFYIEMTVLLISLFWIIDFLALKFGWVSLSNMILPVAPGILKCYWRLWMSQVDW